MTLSIDSTAPHDYSRHIPSIPYTDSPGRLQTLDIWLPRPLENSSSADALWIIYIHGGAWRDPEQDCATVGPAIKHLLFNGGQSEKEVVVPSSSGTTASGTTSAPSTSTKNHHHHHHHRIAGIASLNYRLSPYASHPKLPSDPADPDRNVQHPTHVQDVAHAIRFLKKEYGVGRWVGVGHSCGATLLLQFVAGIGLEKKHEDAQSLRNDAGPEALILLEGIYDIPLMLKNHEPPSCPANIAQIYRDIVEGAFGSSSEAHQSVSPVAGSFLQESWGNGRYVLLAYSEEDELIEVQQRQAMFEKLKKDGWTPRSEATGKEARIVETKDVKGAHDFIWEDGRQTAELIKSVVDELFML